MLIEVAILLIWVKMKAAEIQRCLVECALDHESYQQSEFTFPHFKMESAAA